MLDKKAVFIEGACYCLVPIPNETNEICLACKGSPIMNIEMKVKKIKRKK